MQSENLYSFPEPCLEILNILFSLGKASTNTLILKSGKSKGSILNIIHDLKLLGFIRKEEGKYIINMEREQEIRDIIFDRNKLEILKKNFFALPGVKESIEEVKRKGKVDLLDLGKTFSYHSGTKASKESSWTQIGRVYLGWLRYLKMVQEKEGMIKIKDFEYKENGS